MVFPAAAIALRRTARAAGVASETLP
jgi:hypothetical protein